MKIKSEQEKMEAKRRAARARTIQTLVARGLTREQAEARCASDAKTATERAMIALANKRVMNALLREALGKASEETVLDVVKAMRL